MEIGEICDYKWNINIEFFFFLPEFFFEMIFI